MSSKPGPAGQDSMMRDWMTLWQSEFAAMGLDREMQEGWARIAEAWSIAAKGAVQSAGQGTSGESGLDRSGPGRSGLGQGGSRHDPIRGARADAASRSEAAADASYGRSASGELAALRDEIERLKLRIERLEGKPGRKPERKWGKRARKD